MEFFQEAIKQVPALAVLCFIVFVFIKFLEKRDRFFAETLKESKKIETDNHTKLQKELSEVVKENSQTIKSNTEIMGHVKHALDRIKI